MSQESMEWLNTNVLFGFSEKRSPWWAQEGCTNLYQGPVPVEDVHSKLFNFEILEVDPLFENPVTGKLQGYTENGKPRKMYVRSDNGVGLGFHHINHAANGYGEWLVDNVSNLVDSELAIASAGLLAGGAVGWVQLEMAETVNTPEGVSFRPFLASATSFNGTLATTYITGQQLIVCDNTLSMALSGADTKFKVKRTRNAALRVAEARDALGIVFSQADSFTEEVKALCETSVSERQFGAFVEAYVPVPDAKPTKTSEGKGVTMATNKRERLTQMYRTDERVSPWAGTKFGVLQLVNTYSEHESILRGLTRFEKNKTDFLKGDRATEDKMAMDTLDKILANV